MIPVDNVEEIGIRDIIDDSDMEKVLTILKGDKTKCLKIKIDVIE